MLPLIAAGCMAPFAACDLPHEAPLPTPLVVRVVGRDFYWHFTYPGQDGRFDTPDDILSDKDLVVPHGHPVKLEVTSSDYIYTFRAPALGLVEMAVPENFFPLEFTLEKPGRYDLEVDPLCGFLFAHDNRLMGQLVVKSPQNVRSWLSAKQHP